MTNFNFNDIIIDHNFLIFFRIVLTFMFWSAGIILLFDVKRFVGVVEGFRLPMPAVVAPATIAVMLGGSLLLITDVGGTAWLGAGMLGVFTLLTIPVAHPFWAVDPPHRLEKLFLVLEHVSVIGGLMLAAASTGFGR